MIKKFLKNHIAFFLILVVALVLRLYKIDNPVADWHSWRQADTSSVTRVFDQEGVNMFIPRYQDISNIPSGQDNPNGYRMVEFPLYNLAHLGVFRLGSLNLETAGRLTSIILSLVSLSLIYLIANKLSGKKTALFASFFFALLPFNIFYSRVILPEPLMTTLFLSSFFLLLNSRIFLSAVFLAGALLVKPYAIFFTLPYLLIFWKKWRSKKINLVQILIYGAVALTPFILWRFWIANFPEGIPAIILSNASRISSLVVSLGSFVNKKKTESLQSLILSPKNRSKVEARSIKFLAF